jgi:hypothetical protein
MVSPFAAGFLPAYHSQTESERLSDSIQLVVGRQYFDISTNALEIERLRNFIRICQAQDYGYSIQASLTAVDHKHYRNLSLICQSLRTAHDKTHLDQEDRLQLAPFF